MLSSWEYIWCPLSSRITCTHKYNPHYKHRKGGGEREEGGGRRRRKKNDYKSKEDLLILGCRRILPFFLACTGFFLLHHHQIYHLYMWLQSHGFIAFFLLQKHQMYDIRTLSCRLIFNYLLEGSISEYNKYVVHFSWEMEGHSSTWRGKQEHKPLRLRSKNLLHYECPVLAHELT